MSVALAPSYDVRIELVKQCCCTYHPLGEDRDELLLPFRIYVGRDYEIGEELEPVAYRLAFGTAYLFPENYYQEVRATIYPLPATDCTGDDEPEPVAVGVAY